MSMFQQRHYEAVAKQLNTVKHLALVNVTQDTLKMWQMTVEYFVILFMNDNYRFRRDKFVKACGMED